MALSNKEELFTEASGELQSEVEDALESARESLPAHEALVIEEDTPLNEVMAGLPADLDPSEPAEALRTAQKRFALGEQADAFDEEFSAEVTTALDEIEEAVEALRTVSQTAPELAAALTTLDEIQSDTQPDQTDPAQSDENTSSEPSASTDEESRPNSDARSDEESAQQTINEESATTDEDTETD